MKIRNPLSAMRPLRVLAFVAALSALSCEETAVEPPMATTIQLSPESGVLTALGATLRLGAVVLDQDGNTMADAPVLWSSSAGSVASVDAVGLVTALGNGSSNITAASGSATATALITVEQQVVSVALTPPAATMDEGQSVQLVAAVNDANARPVTNATITWTSSNPLVAVPDGTGLVQGLTAGSATISATAGGVTGVSRVTVQALQPQTVVVSPPSSNMRSLGETIQLSAAVYDRNRREISDAEVSWFSSDGAVATVDGSGRVTSQRNGTVTISARAGTATGTASVTVAQVVTTITVVPAQYTLNVGETARFVATARDANNRNVANASLTWISQRPSVARVDASGLVTGVAPGTAPVTVSSADGDVTQTMIVTVEGTPVSTITVTPSEATLFTIGGTVQLSAEGRNAQGELVSNLSPTWSSGNTTVATVATNGLVTARALGSATISARIGSVTGTARITVSRPVSTVTVAPATASVVVGDSVQLTGTARDASNRLLVGVTFNWSSSNTAVATAGAGGWVRGVAAGTATITAEANGRTATATVTVQGDDDHGGSLATATPISYGDTATGTLDAGDEDWFEIDVTSDAKTVRLTAWAEGSTDTRGFLYDDKEKELTDDDDEGPDRNFLLAYDVSPGKYYVKVVGFRSTTTGDYVFKVDDHGNSDDTATPVSSEAEGEIEPAGNVDYFSIRVTGAGTLIVRTTGTMDTFGELFEVRRARPCRTMPTTTTTRATAATSRSRRR